MKLLIVDDEESAIEAVMKNVDWEKLPFTGVLSASSLQEAEEKLADRDIKVLLSDIEMPGGKGLELVQWVRDSRLDVICIFMTCYADFSYAQKALQLGSFDYILKPIDYPNLEAVLFKACNLCHVQKKEAEYREQGRVAMENQFWRRLFLGDISADRDSIAAYIRQTQMEISPEGRFLPLLLSLDTDSVKHGKDDRDILSFVMRNIAGEVFAFDGVKTEIVTMTGDKVLLLLTLQDIDRAGLNGRLQEAAETFAGVFRQYLNIPAPCFAGKESAIEEIPDQIELLYQMAQNRVTFGKEPSGKDAAIFFVNQKKEEEKSARSQQDAVDRVKDYVGKHLQEELSVDFLAEKVYLNADYLNRIFKKAEGITLGQYISQQKMDRAKWLLRNTDWSIADVAAAVGYYNYSTFNRVFKRLMGMTPQEWKVKKP